MNCGKQSNSSEHMQQLAEHTLQETQTGGEHEETRNNVQEKRRPDDHADDSDGDPDSLRIIVAMETRKLAKLARADDAAKAHQARRTANRDATAQAVADQELTIADLLEGLAC